MTNNPEKVQILVKKIRPCEERPAGPEDLGAPKGPKGPQVVPSGPKWAQVALLGPMGGPENNRVTRVL